VSQNLIDECALKIQVCTEKRKVSRKVLFTSTEELIIYRKGEQTTRQ